MPLLAIACILLAPGVPGWESDAVLARYNIARKLYTEGAFERAAAEFETALQLQPTSARLAFNAARSRERAMQFPAAISGYERYLKLAPQAQDALVVTRLVSALRRQSLVRDKPALAVLYFDYDGGDASLAGLRRGFAQMLTTDLSHPQAPFAVVERVRIDAILQEQALAAKGLVAADSAARAGQLVGARYMVLGAFFTFGGMVRIDARVADTSTGVAESFGVGGPPSDILTLERALAEKIAASLRRRVCAGCGQGDAPPPARPVPIQTVAAYGSALAHLDRGETKEARVALEQLVRERPDLPGASQSLAFARQGP